MVYPRLMRAVVTGANRGIGLEFARQLLRRGDTVEATARRPDAAAELRALGEEGKGRLRIHPLDVSDDPSVRAFAEALGSAPVDLLINNAGVGAFGSALEDLDVQEVLRLFNVNAVGALRVTRALLPNLRQGQHKRVANLTSRMGSIADNTSGGSYAYRMSKAALNMATKSMALDLAEEGISVVVLHPGWVQTDMGGGGALISPEESVSGMLRIIDRLGREDSGKFFHSNGQLLPW